MNKKSISIIILTATVSCFNITASAGIIASTDFNSGLSLGGIFPQFEDGWGQPSGDNSIALNAGANYNTFAKMKNASFLKVFTITSH